MRPSNPVQSARSWHRGCGLSSKCRCGSFAASLRVGATGTPVWVWRSAILATLPRPERRGLASLLAPIAIWLVATPCGAVMDIGNQGPQLDAGRFALRITNVGVLGN